MHVQQCCVTRWFNNASSSHVRRDLYLLTKACPLFYNFPSNWSRRMWSVGGNAQEPSRPIPAACLSQNVVTVLGRCVWPDVCRVPHHSVTISCVKLGCYLITLPSKYEKWESNNSQPESAINQKEERGLYCFYIFICQHSETFCQRKPQKSPFSKIISLQKLLRLKSLNNKYI